MSEARRAAVPGYTLVRGISVDRAGALLEAREVETGRRVVLRLLSPALVADSRFMRRVRGASQLRESLRHPNLVSLLAVADSGRALAYQWIEGVTVDRLVASEPLSDVAAVVLFDDCLRGLEALHQRGILHRDLRPETVVVDRSGRGMLRDADVPCPPLHPGWRAGTPQYMAPELWRGEPHSVASDLYAATCVFAFALDGAAPFAASDLALLRRLHERGDLPGAGLPAPLKGLVAEGLAKDPRQRPADASRFRADLDVAAGAYLGESWRRRGREALSNSVRSALELPPPPVVAGEDPDAEALAAALAVSAAVTPWWRRSRLAAAALLAVLAALVLGVVLGATALTAPPPENPQPAAVPLATPTGGQAPAGGGPFTAPPAASLQLGGTPVPTPQPQVTPDPSASTTIGPVTPSPSRSPSPSPTPTVPPNPTPCPPLPPCR
ncbi:MAG TPA: serine/threonine-protein kinase [Dehalococcoidia bacterium]|nr:serine/threonine-protein kinase [Dehalococcoidia bacterium]